MKILKCIICEGELKVIGKISDIEKKVKCLNCGFCNSDKKEILVYKR